MYRRLFVIFVSFILFALNACSGSPSPQISPPHSQTDPAEIATTTQYLTNNPPSWLQGLELSVPLVPKTELASTTLDIFQPEYWLVWSHPSLGSIAKSKSNTSVTLDPDSLPPGEQDITVTAFSPLDFGMSDSLDQKTVRIQVNPLQSPSPSPTPPLPRGNWDRRTDRCWDITLTKPAWSFVAGNNFDPNLDWFGYYNRQSHRLFTSYRHLRFISHYNHDSRQGIQTVIYRADQSFWTGNRCSLSMNIGDTGAAGGYSIVYPDATLSCQFLASTLNYDWHNLLKKEPCPIARLSDSKVPFFYIPDGDFRDSSYPQPFPLDNKLPSEDPYEWIWPPR